MISKVYCSMWPWCPGAVCDFSWREMNKCLLSEDCYWQHIKWVHSPKHSLVNPRLSWIDLPEGGSLKVSYIIQSPSRNSSMRAPLSCVPDTPSPELWSWSSMPGLQAVLPESAHCHCQLHWGGALWSCHFQSFLCLLCFPSLLCCMSLPFSTSHHK